MMASSAETSSTHQDLTTDQLLKDIYSEIVDVTTTINVITELMNRAITGKTISDKTLSSLMSATGPLQAPTSHPLGSENYILELLDPIDILSPIFNNLINLMQEVRGLVLTHKKFPPQTFANTVLSLKKTINALYGLIQSAKLLEEEQEKKQPKKEDKPSKPIHFPV